MSLFQLPAATRQSESFTPPTRPPSTRPPSTSRPPSTPMPLRPTAAQLRASPGESYSYPFGTPTGPPPPAMPITTTTPRLEPVDHQRTDAFDLADSFDSRNLSYEGFGANDDAGWNEDLGGFENETLPVTASPPSPLQTSRVITPPPAVTMGGHMDVNLRLRLEEMARDSELTERQRKRVVTVASVSPTVWITISSDTEPIMVKVPSMLGEDVPQSITLMIAMSMASYFEDLNESKKNDKELGGFQAVLKEMNSTLEKNFRFNSDQDADIRALLRYQVWDPYRLNHREGLEESVLKYIVKNADALGFAHVAKRPHRVLLLRKEIGEKARQVRNTLRQQVRDSVDIQKVVPLQTFVSQLGPKYVYPGAEGYTSNAVTLKMVMMRHFVVNNPDIVWADEESAHSPEADGEPVQKRAKKTNNTKAAGGRVVKGQDFWSLFDRFMNDKVKELGHKIAEPQWRSYIAELCEADRTQFPGRLTAGQAKDAKKRKVTPSTAMMSGVDSHRHAEQNGQDHIGRTGGFLGTVLS
ncbi:hypothetical protein PM082_011816 [Marasmius tenuissimus]|nr:hypothetical protein PM082_011816 [Marasmius tenuissimus]